jgi:hypothetical protein
MSSRSLVFLIRLLDLPRWGKSLGGQIFQPTTQPTKNDVLYGLRVSWQSPRFCKFL